MHTLILLLSGTLGALLGIAAVIWLLGALMSIFQRP